MEDRLMNVHSFVRRHIDPRKLAVMFEQTLLDSNIEIYYVCLVLQVEGVTFLNLKKVAWSISVKRPDCRIFYKIYMKY